MKEFQRVQQEYDLDRIASTVNIVSEEKKASFWWISVFWKYAEEVVYVTVYVAHDDKDAGQAQEARFTSEEILHASHDFPYVVSGDPLRWSRISQNPPEDDVEDCSESTVIRHQPTVTFSSIFV